MNVDISMGEFQSQASGNNADGVFSRNAVCVLCKYNGCGDKVGRVMEEITMYIEEKINHVHVNEMARQILIVLRDELGDDIEENVNQITEQSMVTHIQTHITKPKAVLHELLQDLRVMAKTAKQASVYKCEESGQTSIDVKVFNTYLKTVDTICSICKSDVMKTAPKA